MATALSEHKATARTMARPRSHSAQGGGFGYSLSRLSVSLLCTAANWSLYSQFVFDRTSVASRGVA